MKLGSEWGKYTWIFFHCLAEKIKPEFFITMKFKLINWIKMICKILPCPYCSEHATLLLEKYRDYDKMNTKEDFKIFLFTFHNIVNRKTHKHIQNTQILKLYEKYDFRVASADWFNNFIVNQTDVKLLFDKKQRNKTRNYILKELTTYIHYFDI